MRAEKAINDLTILYDFIDYQWDDENEKERFKATLNHCISNLDMTENIAYENKMLAQFIAKKFNIEESEVMKFIGVF